MRNPYQYIQTYPRRAKLLLGIEFEQFEQLVSLAQQHYEQQKAVSEQQKTRINAPGGGCPQKLSIAEQICLCLVYLRQMPVFEVLGLLFGVSKTTANETFHRWLNLLRPCLPESLLAQMSERPEEEMALVEEMLEAEELLVDSSEQTRERPGESATQRRYYSGKKKQTTFKNQFITTADGQEIVDVVAGERGPASDVNLLRQQQQRFSEQQGFGGDKGYVGAERTRTPHKKPRNRELNQAQREANQAFSKERIVIEHLIRVVKIFRVAKERFRLSPERYVHVILTICGLVRLRIGSLVLPQIDVN